MVRAGKLEFGDCWHLGADEARKRCELAGSEEGVN